jgi:hypothetical protein
VAEELAAPAIDACNYVVDEAMTHIAIRERKDGKVVDWTEHVGDEHHQSG